MKVINLSEQDTILSKYMSEVRDVEMQKNRMLFRNNIVRIGHIEAYEISKFLAHFTYAFVKGPLLAGERAPIA